MLHNPLGNVLGKPPLSFLPLDPLGSDVDKFPAPSVRGSRLDTRPILDSRSSSPSDSDTSGFSSGSDHLSDLIVCCLSGSRVGGSARLAGSTCPLGCWKVWRPSWAHAELFVLDRIEAALYTHPLGGAFQALSPGHFFELLQEPLGCSYFTGNRGSPNRVPFPGLHGVFFSLHRVSFMCLYV